MEKNSWKRFKIICGNHGDDLSNELTMHAGREGMSMFYSCPCYMSIYKKDPSGRSCNNRLTTVDFEKMINKLIELSDDGAEEVTIPKGYKWMNNGVEYEVLSHKHGKFKVKVLNKKAISK